MGVSSVTEKERRSKKEVGTTQRITNLNLPIGMYREIDLIAESEKKRFPETLCMLLREGLRTWRSRKKEENEIQTSSEEQPSA